MKPPASWSLGAKQFSICVACCSHLGRHHENEDLKTSRPQDLRPFTQEVKLTQDLRRLNPIQDLRAFDPIRLLPSSFLLLLLAKVAASLCV